MEPARTPLDAAFSGLCPNSHEQVMTGPSVEAWTQPETISNTD
jgi:hypothetical protein